MHRAAGHNRLSKAAQQVRQLLQQHSGRAHLGDVHSCKDSCCLADAWQPLSQQLRRQVVQVQVDVVLQAKEKMNSSDKAY
jgi:hypothetical protein